MTTPTPCINDTRFISDSRKVMASVVDLCLDCPFFAACLESGIGEPAGVVAGMLPDDPIRVAHRAAVDKRKQCINGHPIKLYGVVNGYTMSHIPIVVCRHCTDLLKFIGTTPGPIPRTEPGDGILHGTPSGARTCRRRNGTSCPACTRSDGWAKRSAEAAKARDEEVEVA